jgi:ferredoxin--NADP+ reductase
VLDPELPLPADDPDFHVAQKLALLRELPLRDGGRRIALRYLCAPVRVLPDGVELAETALSADGRSATVIGEPHLLEAGLTLTSIGYHGKPVPGLPFDDVSGTVPNVAGRVEPGVYVAGWIKRGPTGFIGTNKSCAQETVKSLIDDYNAGLLT